jgi:hypothetical protein
MTPEDKLIIAMRMMNIERMLSTTIPAIKATARAAQQVDPGFQCAIPSGSRTGAA